MAQRPGVQRHALLLAITLTCLPPITFAQNDLGEPDEVPVDGFFPTPVMVDRAIDRITEELAEQLELDDEQLDQFREVIKARVPQWLERNKGEIKRLTNRYIEALLNGEPPSIEDVAGWANRTLPLAAELHEVIQECGDKMRPHLTYDQAIILDGDLAAIRVGFSALSSKMQLWADGGYDPDIDWPQGAKHREAQQAEHQAHIKAEEAARRAAMGVPDDEPLPRRPSEVAAAQKAGQDEWEKYVERFIERYQLQDGQRERAQVFLREAMETRDRYLAIKLPDYQKLEALIKKTEDPEDLKKYEKRYQRLKAPVERYFTRLKERLDTLPTRSQRLAAAERDKLQTTGSTTRPSQK